MTGNLWRFKFEIDTKHEDRQNPKRAPEGSGNPTELHCIQRERKVLGKLSNKIERWWGGFRDGKVSRVLPLDPRRSTTVGEDRHNEGDGGRSEKDGEFQASDSGGEGVFGDIREGVSDERRIYDMGDPTVVTEVPRESAGSGDDV